MLDFLDLKGKNIVIVGISGAIGSSIAIKASSFGAKIFGFDLVQPRKSISLDFFYLGNATSELDIKSFINHLGDSNVKIDSVILCMGITGSVVDSENIDIKDFQNCISSSVVSSTLFIKYFSPIFKQEKTGNFILLSSIAGIRGAALMPAYTAAKHAINGLMKSFARELGPWGIRLNSISPGIIKSEMAKKIQFSLNVRNDPSLLYLDDDDSIDDVSRSIPIRRVGTPHDVSNLAVFLMSSASSYIHGSVISIDGGLSIKY